MKHNILLGTLFGMACLFAACQSEAKNEAEVQLQTETHELPEERPFYSEHVESLSMEKNDHGMPVYTMMYDGYELYISEQAFFIIAEKWDNDDPANKPFTGVLYLSHEPDIYSLEY